MGASSEAKRCSSASRLCSAEHGHCRTAVCAAPVCAAPTLIIVLKSSAETCCMGQGQSKSRDKMRSHSSGGKSAAFEGPQST